MAMAAVGTFKIIYRNSKNELFSSSDSLLNEELAPAVLETLLKLMKSHGKHSIF